MPETLTKTESSLTIIIKRTAKEGKIGALEEWIQTVSREASKFPGHMGYKVIKPDKKDQREFVIVFRFDTYENLENWISSDIRSYWLKKVDEITVGKPEITTLPGLEAWFQLSDSENRPDAPAKWKMALLIFVSLYPLAIVLGSFFNQLLPDMHVHLRQGIILITTIIIMTWAVLPAITKIFAGWLKNK